MPSIIGRSDESNVAVGIALPQYGALASSETILLVAVEAEKMGLASLWTSDRMLLPTRPKETFDGDSWPEIFATVYDPIEMLTFAAARTRKVKLGTSVMRNKQRESRPLPSRGDLRSWNVRSMNSSNGSRHYGVAESANFRSDPQSASLNLTGRPIYFASSLLSFPEILTVARVL